MAMLSLFSFALTFGSGWLFRRLPILAITRSVGRGFFLHQPTIRSVGHIFSISIAIGAGFSIGSICRNTFWLIAPVGRRISFCVFSATGLTSTLLFSHAGNI